MLHQRTRKIRQKKKRGKTFECNFLAVYKEIQSSSKYIGNPLKIEVSDEKLKRHGN